ncbi:enoyl-CoA hydratase-related protein [Nocardioides sp.]|uniref:enoyl-CoA hydratase-related protein n=1 Tax=Nocardioides sp. TaxID=35761 RepID=UPI002B26A67B|nr:enoyl-CoA hydratase-related protein [Nocardioides sp.]
MTDPAAPSAEVPILVGVAQWSERLGETSYEGLSPVDLAARVAGLAIDDTGAETGVTALLDLLACTRQFDESFPGMPAPLGRSDSFPRSVAGRLGLDPARVIYEVSGGQSPQHLVTEVCGELAAGRSRMALVAGAEAISTVLDLARRDDKPDLTEHVDRDSDAGADRGAGLEGITSRYQAGHGLIDAPTQYALFENARRSRLGLSRAELNDEMGALFAPFTAVAAANPHAAVRVARSADEIMRVTESNRLIVDPYPKAVVSREKVNQGAAVVLTTERIAVELGIERDRWVYLRGHSDLRDRELMRRTDLSVATPAVTAAGAALEMAGIGLADVATFDLYSCFPVAVSIVADGIGLAHDDPRGLTVTGGLPYFGGPGNSYSLHAIAETVSRCRAVPGSFGLVGANGGTLSKYSVGVYSTAPGAWQVGHDERLQARLDDYPDHPIAIEADGWGHVETWTVRYAGGEPVGAIVVGLLDDGRRFLANEVAGDTGPDGLIAMLLGENAHGTRVFVRSLPQGNRATVSEERMAELLPPVPVGFRDDYEFVTLRRDGHVLEITINRPEVRNALTPDASQELSDVLDAYLADRDLWVAILTGARGDDGRGAFCAGNDLLHTAAGGALWMPKTGFGGLTSRRHVHKPIIAALNGHAFGGGFELALACHLVVAEEQAQVDLTEVKVGLVAAMGGLVRLPRALPPHVANEMILTGRRMGAEEAQRWGLVNRVVPTGSALDAARDLAAELLESSPTSVRISLQLMEEAAAHADPVDAATAPTDALDKLLVARDTSEGVTAFAFKQKPRWRNL